MSENRMLAALRHPELIETQPGRVVPVGHRGAPRAYPENTMESLARAVELGAWMVEIDVRQAKDGTLVVFHDEELERMTGAKGTVQSKTAAELAKLSVAGS
jgi:glycerophosphoryl diester phosphodiesterase